MSACRSSSVIGVPTLSRPVGFKIARTVSHGWVAPGRARSVKFRAGWALAAVMSVMVGTACDTEAGSSPASTDQATTLPAPTTTSEAAATTVAAPSTVKPTTTTAAVTTTTMSELELAQAAYYAYSAEINAVSTAVNDQYPDGTPWSDTPAVCAILAPAAEKFAQQLASYDAWPADAQDEIDALVAAVASDAGLYYECQETPGTAALQEPIWAAMNDGSESSAARLALGLPIDR